MQVSSVSVSVQRTHITRYEKNSYM